MSRADLEKQPRQVAEMFDAVAERYDRTNTILSGAQDRRWRRHTVRALELLPGQKVLDVAAGTCVSTRELAATGETARKRTMTTSSQLTAHEALIARMAREGLSNPEIGTRLFLSPRTVEYHLRNVFAKLGIASRHELDRIPVRVLGNGQIA